MNRRNINGFPIVHQALGEVLVNFSLEFTMKCYPANGKWIEEVHWVRLNSRCIRYNLELIQDWAHNCHDPIAHQRAIQVDQTSLLSNQRLKRSAHG
jgi:hypothetical protein